MATAGPQLAQPAQAFAQYPGAYGQPFQSYNQYGRTAGAPLPQTTQQLVRPEVQESKAWTITRSTLHGSGIILAIICIALSFSFMGSRTEVYLAWFTTPVAFIAFIWSLSELIVRAVRKQKAGMHPGAHVGVCLIIWLCASLVGGIHTSFAAMSGYENNRSSNCDSRYDSSERGYVYYNCTVPFNGRFGQFIALTTFSWLLWLVYFILFVGSCIDTHKRNQAKRQPIMVINPGSFWGGQGWQQIPQGAHLAHAPTPDIALSERTSAQQQYQTPAEFYGEKGTGPQRHEPAQQPANAPQITEYYTPSNGRQ